MLGTQYPCIKVNAIWNNKIATAPISIFLSNSEPLYLHYNI